MKYLIVFLLGAVACFFLMRGCNTPVVKTVSDTTYIKSWDTVHDAPKVSKVIYQTQKSTGDFLSRLLLGSVVRRPDTIRTPVDTAMILKDFFAEALYNDTLRVKYGLVIIRDTISQNRIAGRSVIERFSFPDVTTTKTVTEGSKRMLFVGPDIGFGIGASAAYKTKTDHLFGLGYMLTAHGGMLDLSYKWKISIH